jgi:integrase/recombinase XerD
MPAKLPANCYGRNGIIWGRLKVAGREYRRSLRTADPREAARRLKAWRLKLERQEFDDVDAPTFKAAVVKWAKEVLPGAVKPSVAKRYLVSIGQMAEHFGALRVTEINASVISGYISSRSGTATNATVRRDLTALSRLLSSCVAWGWVSGNPARLFDRSIIRERRDPISPPADEDVEKFIAASPPGVASVLRLLEQTGMRENEAVTLTASDLDRDGRVIRLMRTKTNRPRMLDWRTPGGDAGVVLTNAPKSGPLFVSATGAMYRNFASNANQITRRLKAADPLFNPFRVHDLRHRFAIRWLRNGGDIYQLSLHLGHTSLKTTEGYLGHLSARERAVAQSRAQRLGKEAVFASDGEGSQLESSL